MYKDYEHWVDLEEAKDVQISDKGRVRNSKSKKEYKYRMLGDCKIVGFITKKTYTKHGERVSFSVARLVYKYFGDGEFPTDRKSFVFHIDGNKFNNCIDNLFLATSRRDQHYEEWQLEILNQQALAEIQKIIKYRRPYNEVYRSKKLYAIDKQELEQGSLIEVFKNIGKLVEGEPLYNFCFKYVKFTWYKLLKQSQDRIGIYELK